MDKKVLKEILDLHREFLLSPSKGKRAVLYGANLRRADLRRANLSEADLRRANLSGGANLSEANLYRADLRRVDLYGANLRRANLSGANLSEANLSGANLSGAKLPHFQIPQEGSLIGWKALRNEILCKIQIPTKAKRTASLVGRKCRAEYVKVLQMFKAGSGEKVEQAYDKHSGNLSYVKGQIVKPNSYDDDIRIECTNGIHFFLTREEAEEWL